VTLLLLLKILLTTLITSLISSDKGTLLVFYKEREPSIKVLERVNKMLEDFEDQYSIEYLIIDDESSSDKITTLGLPTTHFPFAVVINGKYTAQIDERIVSFIHFPLFMKGIGRHEGNWSIDDLRRVLEDHSLLADENILPVLNVDEETTTCEDEE